MENTPKPQQKRTFMTPLVVISGFIGLTETILGVGVAHTTGGIQVALTIFVLTFPVAMAGAFFYILWNRPYVLYSPFEFGSASDASAFIEAIMRDANKVKDKVIEITISAAEIEKLRQEMLDKNKELEKKIREPGNQSKHNRSACDEQMARDTQ